MRRTTVRDVMTTAVVSVSPDAPFTEVARELYGNAVRAVPVVDADGRLLGVVSEGDLLRTVERAGDDQAHGLRSRFAQRRDAAGRTTAGELMSAPAVTAGADLSIARAARIMHDRSLGWLPVVDVDDRVIGVVGRSDLLTVFLREDAEIRGEVADEVLRDTLHLAPGRVEVQVDDGVVTLAGTVGTRADARLAVRFAERLEGVVGVVDRLTYEVDERVADSAVAPLY